MITPAQINLRPEAADSLLGDPVLAIGIAVAAVSLLVLTVWFARHPKRRGRGAAAICLVISVGLHLVLVFFLPHLRNRGGGTRAADSGDQPGDTEMVFATFDPDAELAAVSTPTAADTMLPLPIRALPDLRPAAESEVTESPGELDAAPREADVDPPAEAAEDHDPMPMMPGSLREAVVSEEPPSVDDLLADWLSEQPDRAMTPEVRQTAAEETSVAAVTDDSDVREPAAGEPGPTSVAAQTGNVPGMVVSDFANRFGQSKWLALHQTGGDESTEAAVEAALRFIAGDQRPAGNWDPITSGAGRETRTLGTDRAGAGRSATTGLTGLALLSMLGAGNTHQTGPYADNVRRGLTYLILNQKPDGSLAGDAALYEATYCHGLAALAMCEVAAITQDPSAIASAAAAVRYTVAMQHPTTGGWRYVKGDPGDTSQLGWQAMVLDAGRMAGVPVNDQAFVLTGRFLRSVRGGSAGGLASYRPGDGPTRTMTAEALSTRLLLGERIPPQELQEAEDYLLRQLPGIGRDNLYGWYYTSLALHQLQDDAWRTWNDAMKKHLLARQQPNGSWPVDSEWGGYGGRVYTTAMAALCLEVYYRHERRPTAIVAER